MLTQKTIDMINNMEVPIYGATINAGSLLNSLAENDESLNDLTDEEYEEASDITTLASTMEGLAMDMAQEGW